MTYKNLQKGSDGEDVRKLQAALNTHGYGLDVDGIFGDLTDSAVRDYQSKNGLEVDGIAGVLTQSSLYGGDGDDVSGADSAGGDDISEELARSGQSASAADPDPAPVSVQLPEYTAPEIPEFSSEYDDEIDALMKRITQREPFEYDPFEDDLYKSYRSGVLRDGARAMSDTAGQAAMLTGGYGSSYAQTAGQQVYFDYLSRLSDRALDMYDRAYERYKFENSADEDTFSALYKLRSDEYDRWADQRDFDNKNAQKAYEYAADGAETLYDSQLERQDADYKRLKALITDGAYSPTDEELAIAGMTRGQANALLGVTLQKLAAKQSTSSKTASSGGTAKVQSTKQTAKAEPVPEPELSVPPVEDRYADAITWAKGSGETLTRESVLAYLEENSKLKPPFAILSKESFESNKRAKNKLHGKFNATSFADYEDYLKFMRDYYMNMGAKL